MGKKRIILFIILLIVGLNALGGGYYGMSGAPGVPLEWLKNSPFKSYFFPSLILVVLVGGSSLSSAYFVITRSSYDRASSATAGTILLIWILTQVAIIGYVSWLQPVMLIAAIFVLLLSQKLISTSKISRDLK